MIIALNNKSNLNKEEFDNYLQEFTTIKTNHTLILCPTFINIGSINNNDLLIGSQNVSSHEDGAYTGEISAKQLATYNVKYAIIGHSERRTYYNESNTEVNRKIKKAFESNIIPILCIGETKEEREAGKVKEILEKEIITATEGLTEEEKEKMIIAYEPIWSIGTGIIPTNEEINDAIMFVKSILNNTKVLYGGSANEKNISELKKITSIDGYLLGGISLKLDKLKEFINILN